MDVRLSPEQQALRDSVAQVVGHLAPTAVAQLDDAERAAKLDAAVTAAGWRELRGATDDGTPWASGVEVAVVAEELGRGLADAPFFGPVLAAELRRLAGAPASAEPETVLLTADLGELAVSTPPEPAVGLAVDAAGASTALALLALDSGWVVGTVALDPPLAHVDLTRPVARPAAGAPVVPLPAPATPVGDEQLDHLVALALATTCADLVGTMQGATELAVAYAAERRQYGVPVGSFQAVQHLLADALVLTEGSRSAARHAAWAVDALPPRQALAAAAGAKAYAARAARTVCETAIQVHGGIGNTWECLAHLHLRRALLSSDAFGAVEANLGRVLDHHLGGDDGLR